jgi:PAS domain S-box-containing protein
MTNEAQDAATQVRLQPADDASVVRASPLPAFLFDLANGAIEATSDSFSSLVGVAAGSLAGRSMWDLLPDGPAGVAELLAGGRVSGAELRHPLRRSDGSVLQTRMWVRTIDPGPRPRRALVVVSTTPQQAPPVLHPSGLPERQMAIGTVDGQWRIDRVSCDVDQMLGNPSFDAIGQSILTVVHPDDSALLMTAVGQAVTSGTGVAFSARVRRADGGWLPCDILVSPLATPPRFAFVLSSSQPHGAGNSLLSQTELDLWAIAQAAHAAETSTHVGEWPLSVVPALEQLSTRELDIVTRLASGKRVPAIAAEIFLSQGTVRNHLSKVFAKLGLHSQQELLDLINRE